MTGDAAVRNAQQKYHLSDRGAYNLVHHDHWSVLEQALARPWSPDDPDGTVMLGLAENTQLQMEIAEYITKNVAVEGGRHLTYGVGPRGSVRLRKAVASFFNSKFQARRPVQPEQTLILPGVGSSVDALTWMICNDGEGVLVPRPLYTGFKKDVGLRARGVLVPVAYSKLDSYKGLDDVFEPQVNRQALETALKQAEKEGVKIRAVLLTNPHNPLGRCYSVEAILDIASFCGENQIHLISDEIYANSVFDNPLAHKVEPFTSVLALDLEDRIDEKLVHVVYGPSKDFGANGLRLGVVCSRNEGLINAVATTGALAWPSYIIQDVWASILEDEEFLDDFFSKNKRLLAENYAFTANWLEQHGIPFYKNQNAGIFMWIDLRSYILPEGPNPDVDGSTHKLPTDKHTEYEQREVQVVRRAMRNGVFVGNGSNFLAEEVGWFRLTFAAPRVALETGFERLWKTLEEVKESGWKGEAI